MTAIPKDQSGDGALRVSEADLHAFCRAALAAAGADEATVDAATRAMMHASSLGVDSHGVRLLSHYAAVLIAGRLNPRPNIRITSGFGAVATLDADDAHGALATYKAMEHAIGLAGQMGIGAVAVTRSSHFGPAGAYALAAAEAGYIGLATCNADAVVRLHDGASRFHGTNPIACGVPVREGRPWLLDMATSAIPYNRIRLYRSLRQPLPAGVASTPEGRDTLDADEAEMLAPIGGEFGFKGAGLAGLLEIFSAVLTGATLSFDLPRMAGPDLTTPRNLGAFVMAIRPDAFVDKSTFDEGLTRYLDRLRASPARDGCSVMAPGDREWAEAERRAVQGIPLDPVTIADFERLAERFDLALPFAAGQLGRTPESATKKPTEGDSR
ncbi:Ldh family oxidoreductase [Microbaculum marinum]|uniref:Ldh family oxidoreductase n=1 Tax=Microbaculum marinum TaxID=1764581 RepID=A0AAW9RRU6_9HYPH